MDPLYVAPLSRLLQHRLGGVESAQTTNVSGFSGQSQQLTRPATYIEYAIRRHHQWKAKAKVLASSAECVV